MLKMLFSDIRNGVLSAHQSGPFLDERVRFIELRFKDGYDELRLANVARVLLWVAHSFHADIVKKKPVKAIRLKASGARWFQKQCRCRNRKANRAKYLNLFQLEASSWLRSIGVFEEELKRPNRLHKYLIKYLNAMEQDLGYAADTIKNKRKIISDLFSSYLSKGLPLAAIRIADLDLFMLKLSRHGYCRRSMATVASELRSFMRFARQVGWCPHIRPEAIDGPRVYRSESIPAGPSWEEVKQLIGSADTDRSVDVRDLPILMLFATYGMRAAEVANLRLEDIDWQRSQIKIRHAKNHRTQTFPLVPTVGNAILHYLRAGRPRCDFREVFINLTPPIKPISRGSLHHVVEGRMRKLGIRGLHRGPHSLRHACATHLLAEGFSMKHVGDQLGHVSSKSTSTYAKVDFNQLQIVADFNFGGVL